MTRFLLSFVFTLTTTVAAWSQNVVYNPLGSMACLKSIAYRAGCGVTSDDICAELWNASVKLCNDHDTSNRRTYAVARTHWSFLKFVEQDRRKSSRWECGEGDRLAELARQEQMERNDPNAK